MKKGTYLALALLIAMGVLAAMFVAACGDEEPATTTAGPATTAAPGGDMGEDLVIGALNSITGVNALTGYEQKWAQERAAADINAKGGIKLADGKMHKVVLKFADDKSSDSEAAAAMERLIKSDGLKVILSSNTTPYNQAAATVAEQYQVYFHGNTSWTDEGFFGGMGLQWTSMCFESAADSGLVAVGAAEQLPEVPQKWAVLYENNPDGIGWAEGQKGILGGKGYEIVVDEKFVEGLKDFSSIILKMKEAGVEALDILISPADGNTLVKQMKEQGWSPKYIFGFKGFWPVAFYQGLGTDANYIGHDGFWTETYTYPYAAELGQVFRDEHDGVGSVSVGLPYATMQVLATAIETAGVFEPGPIRDAVWNHSFPGTTMGDLTYNDKGIADIPFLSLQWKDGLHEVVWPVEFQTQKTEVFVPWDER